MSTFLIAEAGVNHNGKLATAYELIDAAKWAGADAVKFQFFDSQRLWGDDRIKHLELRFDDFCLLKKRCDAVGIEFMCTPFGVAELVMLKPLLRRVKVSSGMNKRRPFLEAVADTELPVVLSTGMTTWEEMSDAFILLQKKCSITVLHCTSSYPCRLEDVNLLAMANMRRHAFPYGLSDHTTGITVPIAAVALGAVMLEKHFTLDRNQEGPDHKASITPKEFKAMRLAITEVEYALGDGVKRVMDCEKELRAAWRGN